MPDDGNRYEAIEGDLYMTPAPSILHHRLTRALYEALKPLLTAPRRGELFWAPVGVEFPSTGEGVQPDLFFVSDEHRSRIGEHGIVGAPDLVVEILSPSTASHDRGIKRRLYERQGVGEYWIVDPDENVVDVWRFGEEPAHERFTETLPVRRSRTGRRDRSESRLRPRFLSGLTGSCGADSSSRGYAPSRVRACQRCAGP